MWSMVFLMHIQIAGASAALDTNHGTHILVVSIFAPAILHLKFIQILHSVHLEEVYCLRDVTSALHLFYLNRQKSSREA